MGEEIAGCLKNFTQTKQSLRVFTWSNSTRYWNQVILQELPLNLWRANQAEIAA